MTDLDRALVRALLRRDWAPPRLLPSAAIVAAVCAVTAHGVAVRDRRRVETGGVFTSLAADVILPWLGAHLGVLAAVAVVLAVIERLGADEQQRWLPPLVAGGVSPGAYVATVTASATARTLALLLVASLAWAAGLGAHWAHVMEQVRRLPGAAALVVAFAAYGAAAIVLARTRARAITLAMLGVVVPAIVVLAFDARPRSPAPRAVGRVVALHLPLTTQRGDLATVSRQLAYAAAVGALLVGVAGGRVGRES